MTSRKLYQATADRIREQLLDAGRSKQPKAEAFGVYRAAYAIAQVFAADNPRFDYGRFMTACGFDGERAAS